jgi:hypothetical protein
MRWQAATLKRSAQRGRLPFCVSAYGIVACLMAFNALVWKTRDEHIERLFYCALDSSYSN